VLYTTDNGPHQNSWPDAGTTPFRSEKNTNWEGAFRVPCLIRWPGHIQPGSVSNGIFSGLDWLPTFMAAAGDPDVTNKLLKGYDVGGKTYKVHLDGYNQLPYLTGQQDHSARKEFIYFNDDGDLVALRYENWKAVFEEQGVVGTLRIWAEPFTKLRVPKFFNLRSDPYERADITSNTYYDWFMSDGAGALLATQPIVAKFLATFKDYPPTQRPSSLVVINSSRKCSAALARAATKPALTGIVTSQANNEDQTASLQNNNPVLCRQWDSELRADFSSR
jgi:Sulfatase